MRNSRLSALLVAAALVAAPSAVALAAPASPVSSTPDRAPAPTPTGDPSLAPAAASDAEVYAAREEKDKDVAKFEGGRSVIIIGGSTLGIVLLVVLLVILL